MKSGKNAQTTMDGEPFTLRVKQNLPVRSATPGFALGVITSTIQKISAVKILRIAF